MATRSFAAASSTIVHSAGALSSMTYGTVAALIKTPGSLSAPQPILHVYSSTTDATAFVFSGLYLDGNTPTAYWTGQRPAGTTLSTNTWYLIVLRKASGNNATRFSIYNYSNSTWSHTNTSNSGNAPGGTKAAIRFNYSTNEYFSGIIAARAVWVNSVPWAASTGGDSDLIADGLHTSFDNWVSASPSALWRFDQDPKAAVDDLIGSANQISEQNTAVSTDMPPGFTFGGSELIEGTASSSVTTSATGIGHKVHRGTATSTVTASQAAVGVTVLTGEAESAVTASGEASGLRRVVGTAASEAGGSAVAAGVCRTAGEAASSVTTAGAATGVSVRGGTATSSATTNGEADGTRRVVASAESAVATAQTASGRRITGGATAESTVTTSDSATGVRAARGTAGSSVVVSGAAEALRRVLGAGGGQVVPLAASTGLVRVVGAAGSSVADLGDGADVTVIESL